jgi:inorganic pyrophosphatase
MIRNFSFIFILLLAVSCSSESEEKEASAPAKEVGIKDIPAYDANGSLQMIVEIPQGSDQKIEYNPKTNKFELDRVIEYGGYPGAYGFIPSTLMDPDKGGDGDALDVILFQAPHVKTGDTITIMPIGMIKLMDSGEIDDKIVAFPWNPEKDRPIKETGVTGMYIDNAVDWFLNYKGKGVATVEGILKMDATHAEIKKWMQ